jgi:hypothetical protein
MREYKHFLAGELFKIKSNPQLNKENFRFADRGYPYFTRTAVNNGILGYVDYLDEEHKIKGNTLAIGMIEMRFHYMEDDFYAGQFTKTAFPIFKGFNKRIALYFITLFGKYQSIFQSMLVRDFESTFNNIQILLPVSSQGKIDFIYMENYIRELETIRIHGLETYLKTTGLADYELSNGELQIVSSYKTSKTKFNIFKIIDIFDVKNTQSILSSAIAENSGNTPYLTASATNNAVGTYIEYDKRFVDKGDCIFIGGKTFVVSYQEKDFYSNDSHNLALYLKAIDKKTRENQLFMVSAIYKSLGTKYTWGDSISKKKIQTDTISLPADDLGTPDYNYMTQFIRIQQKLAVKKILDWKELVLNPS